MKKAFIALFLIICLVPLSVMTILPGIARDYENRPLARFPDRIGPEFPSELQRYFSDNLGLRPVYISIASALTGMIFNESGNDKVIKGKEGWLFYSETSGDYVRQGMLSESEIHRIYRKLKIQADYLKNQGVGFYFICAPNKNSVYGEYMPSRYRQKDSPSNLGMLSALLLKEGFPFIPVLDVLVENKEAASLYYKKDTHWNNMGAYLAYAAILRDMGIKEISGGMPVAAVRKDHYGDLQKMLTPAFRIYDEQHYPDIEKKYEYISGFRSMDDMVIRTESAAGGKTLLMFRDSFANALIPFLSNDLGSAVYLRQFPYDHSSVEAFDTDFVLLETAERNLPDLLAAPLFFPSLPADIRDPDGLTPGTGDTASGYTEEDDMYIFKGMIPSGDVLEVYVRLEFPDIEMFFEAAAYDDQESGKTMYGALIEKKYLPSDNFSESIFYREHP